MGVGVEKKNKHGATLIRDPRVTLDLRPKYMRPIFHEKVSAQRIPEDL